MRLWQANLGRGVSPDEYVRNLRRVLNAAGTRAVLCFQEIDEADAPAEWDILRSLTAKTHPQVVGERTDTPILIPRHLDMAGALVTPACKGLAKYTPARSVVEAGIRLPGLTVGVLNVHLPIKRAATTTRRIQAGRVLRARARSYDAGVWAGDVNDRNYRTVVRGERTVIDAGIDKARAWAAPGWQLVVSDRQTVPLSIDGHNAHGARLRWVRK